MDGGYVSRDRITIKKLRLRNWLNFPKDRRLSIYRKKEAVSENEDEKYEARLVAKGYSQIEDIDFIEIFSLVVKHISIKLILGIIAM